MRLTRQDRLGLLRPALDAHTLGLSSLQQILQECGFTCLLGDDAVGKAVETPQDPRNGAILDAWVRSNRLTAVGVSYRLDPTQGADLLGALLQHFKQHRLLSSLGGPIRAIYFAGLPQTCEMIAQRVPEVTAVFDGDETAAQTLEKLGIDPALLGSQTSKDLRYDQDRLAFGGELVRKGEYESILPANPRSYTTFGSRDDSVVLRILDSRRNDSGPVVRAHVGPYLPDRDEAVKLFLEWSRTLASSGHLDVLSIGTSQLSQSNFGADWAGAPNGGGVPINSVAEYVAAYEASRPMLLRTYAGTSNVLGLARMYEGAINIAWHALSLWWFCRIDGRGPNTVLENLRQHVETIRYIASTGKPFEANVSHHFAFRGGDDVTYIVSAVLAARLAKAMGIHYFVLQNMLNTPKATWGVADLAKSRAMLELVRQLQSKDFHVILQTRAGLDYFSPDPHKAKVQLAASTALMDDIEPRDPYSPHVIHVVSYCEASRLADPAAVDESIKITRHALAKYRRLRSQGNIDDMAESGDVAVRTAELLAQAHARLAAIDAATPDACSAEGLYRILAEGYLPVPYLWQCRDEFPKAVKHKTRFHRGGVQLEE